MDAVVSRSMLVLPRLRSVHRRTEREKRRFSEQCRRIGSTGCELISNGCLNLRFCLQSDGMMEGRNVKGSLIGRRVAFTTPSHYAPRLAEVVRRQGAEVLWCPTITAECTAQTRDDVDMAIKQIFDSSVSGVAFSSRAGIQAFSVALAGRKLPGDPFIVAALGKDADYLKELDLIEAAVLTPAVATPSALVEALGEGKDRTILCPVPLVEGLEEPPVIPDFLRELMTRGWSPVRVNAYVTRWIGKDCGRELLKSDIDALIFTSTAEIEGLLKSWLLLQELPGDWRRRENRTFLVATHGPVTADGAARLGVEVDVVGRKFDSFSGVVEQLAARLG